MACRFKAAQIHLTIKCEVSKSYWLLRQHFRKYNAVSGCRLRFGGAYTDLSRGLTRDLGFLSLWESVFSPTRSLLIISESDIK